ncbi:MAG: LacI family transcriptional regulator [Verrucomicrobia bacterium]|jgi:LacI family transcriptional regulator|nr:LacI family transcriptional regulator [Verrucomicrobiota bacterium]
MDKPPTYQEIARRAGVSIAAVSFALRNGRKVSAETRERVQRAARELGYQPNPLLAAYQSEVRTRKSRKFQATLAWINDHPQRDFWTDTPYNRVFWDAAVRRAAELGYRLDNLWMEDLDLETPQDNIRKFLRILRARGIHGVILPMLMSSLHATLEWEGCATVLLGEYQQLMRHARLGLPPNTRRCQHHQVNPDHFHNITLALRSLNALGYQRIGLVISPWYDMVTDGLCAGGFWSEQREWPASRRLPPYSKPTLEELPAWLKRHRPDVVIGYQRELRSAVENDGRRIPEDIGVAHLNLAPDVAGWSGIHQQADQIAAATVDLVAANLQHNERGTPPYAKEVLIKGRWVDGKTTRKTGDT